MKLTREYISITFAYLVVVIYVLFDNNLVVSIILIICLFTYHLILYSRLQNKLAQDREASVSKLQFRLDKSKRQQEESYQRFISLSTSFGSGLLMIDGDGIIKLANSDVNNYFDRDFNNVDYQSISDIKPLYKFVNQAFLLEKNIRKQIKFNNHVYDLISTPLFENQLFQGSLILIHDITLIKRAEKYQKQFTADVSHELRTPLSAIKGFSEILARDKGIDVKEREEFIELIRSESERMEVILNDLMIISKMDRVDYELDLQTYNIATVIEECVGVLKQSIKSKGLKYSVDVEKQMLGIDKHKISQVLLNLIKNALNYTDEGSIEIKGEKKKNEYIISISDTGIGVKEENYDKIFKRFYRVDKARSRDTGGSGLGLSISKNVIRKHAGDIEVSSTPNEGSTFTVKLPINR